MQMFCVGLFGCLFLTQHLQQSIVWIVWPDWWKRKILFRIKAKLSVDELKTKEEQLIHARNRFGEKPTKDVLGQLRQYYQGIGNQGRSQNTKGTRCPGRKYRNRCIPTRDWETENRSNITEGCSKTPTPLKTIWCTKSLSVKRTEYSR